MYPHILSRLINTPLLIESSKLDIITSKVSLNLLANTSNLIDTSVKSDINTETSIKDEVGIITIRDSLVAKNGLGASGCTSYEWIKETIDSYVKEGITNILLDISSGGGEAAGCFPLTDYIYSLQQKGINIIGFTDTAANSAAYAILSSCKLAVATDIAFTGSIGAVMSLVDVTKMDMNLGISYEILRSKEMKGGYSPHEKISEDFKKDILENLNLIDTKFDLSVLKYRKGKVTQESLTTLAGRSINAEEGLKLGLIDQVVSGIDEALGLFKSSSVNVNFNQKKGINMSQNQGENATLEANFIALSAEHNVLKANLETKVKEVVSAETARCSAIVKAGTAYKVDSALVLKAIEKNYSMEVVEDIFSTVAESNDNASGVRSTGNTNKFEAGNAGMSNEETPKSYLEQLMAAIPTVGAK